MNTGDVCCLNVRDKYISFDSFLHKCRTFAESPGASTNSTGSTARRSAAGTTNRTRDGVCRATGAAARTSSTDSQGYANRVSGLMENQNNTCTPMKRSSGQFVRLHVRP